MYGTLADAEPSGGFPHGGAVLNNIGGQLAGPLLDISLQGPTLPIPICSMYMRGKGRTCGNPEKARRQARKPAKKPGEPRAKTPGAPGGSGL